MLERIVSLYGDDVLRKSAMNIRDGGGVFEQVLKGKGYRHVLEIGTYRGVSAAEISRYVERVTTIDLMQGKLERNSERFDRSAFWESLGCDNITLIQVMDDIEKRTFVDSMEFDLAFIDGGHDARSVRADFDMVKRCGRVLFHDADDNRLRPFKRDAANDVHEFIATLPREQVQFMDDVFAFWQRPTKQ